jgi:hypothetical protein
MPFKSEAQRRYLYANEPKIAERWSKETPKGKKLPKRVKPKKRSPLFDAMERGKQRLGK